MLSFLKKYKRCFYEKTYKNKRIDTKHTKKIHTNIHIKRRIKDASEKHSYTKKYEQKTDTYIVYIFKIRTIPEN